MANGQVWSKEPWEISHKGVFWAVIDADGKDIEHEFGETMEEANAARAVDCVNALAGIPSPSGIPHLIAWAKRIQAKQKALCTCDPPGDWKDCDFVELDSCLRACGFHVERMEKKPETDPGPPPG